MAWTFEQVTRFLENIPGQPGVYLMRDRTGRVLYVGKAIHLRNRVANYFQKTGDPRPFVRHLSEVLDRIDTVVTGNEKEALILENELIKKHRPPFNVFLKDDKTYLYLRLDPSTEFPRLELVRRRRTDGALYFGPFHKASSVRATHVLVNRHFGLRTCTDAEMRNRTRPCLEHQMGRCPGPCAGLAGGDDYGKRVEAAILFLRGRHDDVRRRLAERMTAAAEDENFEEAARLRDQIKAVETALAHQAVVLPTTKDTDVIGFARSGDCAAFAVMRFEAGVLTERIPFVLDGVMAPEEDLVESFLAQYYGKAPVPSSVVLPPGLVERPETLAAFLAGKEGRPVEVRAAVRGTPGEAVRNAVRNAEVLLAEGLASGATRDRGLDRVAELVGLDRPPRRIEAYDMSTLFSSEPVGSRVVFTDGRPDRRAYRTYAVRGEDGPGDVGFMREVLRRRFARTDDDEGSLPDLVLLDGGEAQLRVAVEVLSDLGLAVPLVALAKSRVVDKGHGPAEHSPERLFVPALQAPLDATQGVRETGEAVLIVPPRNDPGLHMLMRLRDEAHRVAVTYHRKRRSRRDTGSILDGITGLGKTRRTALLRHFGSVAAIRGATYQELAAAPGLPVTVAEALFARIHGGPTGDTPRKPRKPRQR
jgi:excinuclease ABC subunit C